MGIVWRSTFQPTINSQILPTPNHSPEQLTLIHPERTKNLLCSYSAFIYFSVSCACTHTHMRALLLLLWHTHSPRQPTKKPHPHSRSLFLSWFPLSLLSYTFQLPNLSQTHAFHSFTTVRYALFLSFPELLQQLSIWSSRHQFLSAPI